MPVADKLDPDKIKSTAGRIGNKVIVYDSTSSTNCLAAEYANDKGNDGLVIFAEEQTAGRGRGANKWLSPKGTSILCSILLMENRLEPELLTLACAVAVADTLGHHTKIKWPNDIILGGRKIAGILLESKSVNDSTCFIIGIGINCHQRKDDLGPELQNLATSLDIRTGSVCDRNVVAKRLLASIEHWLGRAEKNSKKIIKKWRKLSTLLNQRITVIYNDKKFTGTCTGIDPQKGLILQLDTGGIRFFDAAHTSIAK